MEFIFLIIGIIIGSIVVWFIRKYKFEASKGVPQSQVDELTSKLSTLNIDKSRAEERNVNFENNLNEVKKELTDERLKVITLKSELAKSQADYSNLQEKLQDHKIETEQIQQKFTNEFENLANKILEDKSKRFTEQNKINIDEILKPLNEKISDFQKKVEETYDKESQQRFSLKTEIGKLYDLNQQMSKEANNLTNAIKGESQTQGNWGEMILESILEKSGLVKGREFLVQESMTNEEGKRQKPDVIINLPEKKNMVIDSKVSLTAYDRYFSTEDKNQRAIELKGHITSIRNHIKELSQKNYQSIYQINNPDFVLMFLPIEPAFGLAVQYDHNLFYDAFEKNIVIVSPSTLLATLRTISSIWRQENQNRNAMEIARQGGALYDKFVSFVEDLIEVGKKMQTTQKIYEEAMSKLHRGSGNLVKRAQDIKDLGAKTSKALPQTLLDRTDN